MKNSVFARFAHAFFIFWHFEDVLVLSTTWNDLFCSCVDDMSIWWQMFNFVFLCLKRWFQFNSRIVRTHFSSIVSLNNWKMIAETRSHIFRWRSRFRRRRVCLSSLLRFWRQRELVEVNLSFSAFTWKPLVRMQVKGRDSSPISYNVINTESSQNTKPSPFQGPISKWRFGCSSRRSLLNSLFAQWPIRPASSDKWY